MIENSPINKQICPINQTHPRTSNQNSHIPNLLEFRAPPLPYLKCIPRFDRYAAFLPDGGRDAVGD
jgi:hypothetical protein